MRRFVVKALAVLALLPAALFGSFALAATGTANEALAASLSASSVRIQAEARDALLASDGVLYPADALGGKLADSWEGYAYSNDVVGKLFIADDVTAVPYSVVVPLNSMSQMTVNIRGLSGMSEVEFLLDSVSGKSACKTIPRSEFRGCASLRSVKNLDATSLVSIGDRAFEKCSALAGEISLPATCNRIGDQAFYYCKKVSSVSTSGVKVKVGDQAFARCYSLASLSLVGVATVGEAAFQRCTSLTSVALPEACTSIGNNAFADCSALASVSFADAVSLKKIGEGAFKGAVVKSVALPDSCTKVGGSAFAKCKQLKTFAGGKGLNSIGAKAFDSCTKLAKVSFGYAKKVVSAGSYLFCNTKFAKGKAKISVPGKLLDAYRAKAKKAKKSSAWRKCKFKALAKKASEKPAPEPVGA